MGLAGILSTLIGTIYTVGKAVDGQVYKAKKQEEAKVEIAKQVAGNGSA